LLLEDLLNLRENKIKKGIKKGNFITFVRTSNDLKLERTFQKEQGCILKFHPSMRRAPEIYSCDISWISPHKYQREILFARSMAFFDLYKTLHTEHNTWNVHVESETEDTQVILLRWSEYDNFIEQTWSISSQLNHVIDWNVIYILLKYFDFDFDFDTRKIVQLLIEFDEWKKMKCNEQAYQQFHQKLIKNRCCNYDVNVFCYFLFNCKFHLVGNTLTDVQFATMVTIIEGLPFSFKDKQTETEKRQNTLI